MGRIGAGNGVCKQKGTCSEVEEDTCEQEGKCNEAEEDKLKLQLEDFMPEPPEMKEPPAHWSEEDKELYRQDQAKFKRLYEEGQHLFSDPAPDRKPYDPENFRKLVLDEDDLADYESIPPYQSKVLVVKPGKGSKVIELGDVVTIHVKSWSQPSGLQVFDSREDHRTRPPGSGEYETQKKGILFEVGSKRIPKGWSVGILGAKKREIRRVFVTESSGEGFAGRTSGKARKIQRPEVTPPDSLFEIEVLKIVRKGDGYVKGIDDQLEEERLLEEILPMFMETQS